MNDAQLLYTGSCRFEWMGRLWSGITLCLWLAMAPVHAFKRSPEMLTESIKKNLA